MLSFYFLCSQVREYEGKDTALLVDRYRFLDLFPCSKQELRSVVTPAPLTGYPSVGLQVTTSSKSRSHKPQPTLHSAALFYTLALAGQKLYFCISL